MGFASDHSNVANAFSWALLIAAACSFNARAQDGYTVRGISITISEIDVAAPLKKRLSTQADVQLRTQSAYLSENADPFAYAQRLHIRPWLHFDRNAHTRLSFSTSYVKRYEVSPLDSKPGDEIRLTAMTMLTQPRSFGAVFEQLRLELRNSHDKGEEWSHVPRLRFRFGQNYDIGESRQKPRLNVYQEIMLKYQEHRKALDIVRGYVGYGFNPRTRVALSLGFLAQANLKSSGRDFDTYFGPSISVRYSFGRMKRAEAPPDPDPD